MANETRTIYAFAHTHWDREWYLPFESFRAQLVSLVRSLLPRLQDGSVPKFYLDGQAIILEDVIAIDPSLAPQIKTLMDDGKLTAGPWYVMPDEMLVGGESLIRNLSIGMQLTRQFGEPALIGYSPDTFGHSGDLPTILTGFGINSAIVWRGVPLLEMGPVFWWNAPSGARVLAYHLTLGYMRTDCHDVAHGKASDECVTKLSQNLRSWVNLAAGSNGSANPYYKLIGGTLMPMGGDHVGPPPNLQKIIDKVNAAAKKGKLGYQIQPTNLVDFMHMVEDKVTDGIKLVQGIDGELRFNRAASFYERAYLLYGVMSTRLYLKRANRISEYRLGRLLEPVRAIADLALKTGTTRGEFEHAWKLLLQNHPHDSICGCSVDAVHDEMMTRTARLHELVNSLLERVAVDTSKHDRSTGVSHVDPDAGANRITAFNATASTASAPVFLQWIEPLGSKRFDRPNENVQVLRKYHSDQLFSGWGTAPYYKDVDVYEGWVWAEDVPSCGFRSFEWPRAAGAESAHPPATSGPNRLGNGHLSATVSTSGRITVSYTVPGEASRTYRLNHTIRDVADCGDTYNFDPIPGDKPIEARLTGIKQGKKGPLVASLLLSYEIEIPEENVPDANPLKRNDVDAARIEIVKRSRTKVKHEIEVEVTLKRGIPILFFDARWTNKSRDHRLEVCIDTGADITTTYSESHLSVTRRHHKLRPAKEKLPVPVAHEAGPDRFPSQRFVMLDGQVVLNTGMPEYGVDGSKLTLTMLRAVSYLSKPRLWTRGGGAGPNLHTPGANCIGPNECSYGWAPIAGAFSDVAEAYRLAELYEGALWGALGKARLNDRADGADARSFVHISNPTIRGIAFYERAPNEFTLRLLNVTNDPQTAKLHINFKHASVDLIDFGGEVQQHLKLSSAGDGHTIELKFNEYEVKTLRLSRSHKTQH